MTGNIHKNIGKSALMNSAGDGILGNMPKLLRKLLCGPLLNQDPLPSKVKGKGIYVFYENGQPLYVGLSDGLAKRIKDHSGSDDKAAFAFILTRDQ
jgi:hypothetical protein